MKRLFFTFLIFFLTSCSFQDFKEDSECPLVVKKTVSVLFEFDSAEMNPKALKEIEQIALEAKKRNDSVCLVGVMKYDSVPAYEELGAIERIKTVGNIFLQKGISPESIFIGLAPLQKTTGVSSLFETPQANSFLKILIGK